MPNRKQKNLDDFKQKNVCFHASAVNISGKALLFLGHSTSGKSTISQLLSKRYPVIADDKVWVFQVNNGSWIVQDGSDNSFLDYSNNSLFNHETYPLYSILRIFKSDKVRINPISEKRACKYLMDSVFEIDFQRKTENIDIKKEWFFYVANIAKNIVGYSLTFPKNETIIKKINDVFENQIL